MKKKIWFLQHMCYLIEVSILWKGIDNYWLNLLLARYENFRISSGKQIIELQQRLFTLKVL